MKTFALLTCDSVTIDSVSGKHMIVGHFSSIKVKSFPATHPGMTLFVALTDIPAGEHSLQVKWGLPTAVKPAPKKNFVWDTPKAAPDPMQTLLTQPLKSTGQSQKIYFIFEIKDLYFEAAGDYVTQVWVDGVNAGNVSLAVS